VRTIFSATSQGWAARSAIASAVILAACGVELPPTDGGSRDGSASSEGGLDAGGCPTGLRCVDAFPYRDMDDTSTLAAGALDGYACRPTTSEGGPEVVYRVALPDSGFLSAAVYSADGADLDVHVLTELDPSACVDGGDHEVSADLIGPGFAYVVVDTYDGGGTAMVGAYRVDIGFVVPSEGPCAMDTGSIARVGDGGSSLAMPATGPLVMEAHLVTQEEPSPYPTTATEELAAHYELSQMSTGLVMYRTQVWAPLEGGSFYGAGIGDPSLFPVVDEGWYVNMYWTSAARPARSTRMIIRDPTGGSRAVVVSAGFETGPGDLAAIGGATEESHFYLGTTHRSTVTLGFATDTTLPLGPRRCTD
jgi:hypothetical protein